MGRIRIDSRTARYSQSGSPPGSPSRRLDLARLLHSVGHPSSLFPGPCSRCHASRSKQRMKKGPLDRGEPPSKGPFFAGGIRSLGFDTALARGPIDFPFPGPLRSRSRCFRIRQSYSHDQRPRDRSVDAEPSTGSAPSASRRSTSRPRMTVPSDAAPTFTCRTMASIENFFRSRQTRLPDASIRGAGLRGLMADCGY